MSVANIQVWSAMFVISYHIGNIRVHITHNATMQRSFREDYQCFIYCSKKCVVKSRVGRELFKLSILQEPRSASAASNINRTDRNSSLTSSKYFLKIYGTVGLNDVFGNELAVL